MTFAVRRVCEALLVSAACAALSVLSAQSAGTAKQPPPLPPDLPAFAPVPTTFEGLFAERDARALDVLGYLRCIEATVAALRALTSPSIMTTLSSRSPSRVIQVCPA